MKCKMTTTSGVISAKCIDHQQTCPLSVEKPTSVSHFNEHKKQAALLMYHNTYVVWFDKQNQTNTILLYKNTVFNE